MCWEYQLECIVWTPKREYAKLPACTTRVMTSIPQMSTSAEVQLFMYKIMPHQLKHNYIRPKFIFFIIRLQTDCLCCVGNEYYYFKNIQNSNLQYF